MPSPPRPGYLGVNGPAGKPIMIHDTEKFLRTKRVLQRVYFRARNS